MAAHVDPIREATEVWKEVFGNGPYSSFGIHHAKAKYRKLTYEDILANPARLRDIDGKSVTEDNLSKHPFSSTWSSVTGRYTSFALKATALLETRHPNIFKFHYYDIGKHRVARCVKTGILIDPSSKVGPYF